MDRNKMLDEIRSYIEIKRIRRGISNIDQTRNMELSGIMRGMDDDKLSPIERQLMTTEYVYGA